MCYVIELPDGSTVGTINQLEKAFGVLVDEYHYHPEILHEELLPGETPVRDCCMCQVDLEDYLTHVGATWHYLDDYEGDINVLMMPPQQPFNQQTL